MPAGKFLMMVGAVVTICGSASAQGLVTQRNLSLGMAKTIAEATIGECHAKGFHTAAAVVDRAGQVLVILRDEQATATTVEMARRKAFTARVFRSTTLDFRSGRPIRHSPRNAMCPISWHWVGACRSWLATKSSVA